MRLDRSGVIMASSMVSGNHWSCVYINSETGDRLEMDFMQIQYGEKFHAILETHLATIFKQYEKYTKKNLYQIHAYEIQ